MNDIEYRSGFDRWDEQSWIRTGPRRVVAFAEGLHFFSPELSPLLTHPAVREAGDEFVSRVLVYDLYRYLDFTVKLEMGPVNQVCSWLAGPNFLNWLPQRMKDDALRIYADEAGHAEMSNTLTRSVADYTGLRPMEFQPQFLRTLEELKAEWPAPYAVLIQLFFVIVSETLITGSLKRLPHDETVQQQVRFVAADHASDEGKHHSYFRQLFFILWDKMSGPLRLRVATVLPRIILAFLSPDGAAMRRTLFELGMDESAASRIANEILASEATRTSIVDGAVPTMKMLRQARLLDLPGAHDVFRDLI